MRDAMDRAGQILGELGTRPVAAMTYSTALAARLTAGDGRPAFPRAREWLRDHQHPDGSWGGRVLNPYDRLVSTLAAVLALHEVRDEWAVRAVSAGVAYLRDTGSDWRGAVGEPIGFEVVAPYLVDRTGSADLLCPDALAELVRLRDDKLARIPPGALSGGPTALLYSLEALEQLVPLHDMARFAGPNGSMANNPAATGALWAATRDPAALEYLTDAARSTGDGGMPEIFPIDVFEPSWVIYLLHRGGVVPFGAKVHVDRLLEGAVPLGVSTEFPVPDSDDTAMVANVANAFGYPTTPILEALLAFETDTHFVGFAHERGAPVSANARVLEALAQQPHRFAAQIAKVTAFLLDTRRESAWWCDKWHLSPYYATAQAVFGLVAADAAGTLAGTRRWLLDGQHPDGSWGACGGQPEETAYAVLSLDALAPGFGPPPADTYRRAHTYLGAHLDTTDHAELWIGKGLYAPPTVVRAGVLAAYAVSGVER